ncbi:N/A [soil metagenome]
MAEAAAARPAPRGRRPPLRAGTLLKHATLILVAVAIGFPFYWMVTTAFKDFFEATRFPPTLLPVEPTLANFPAAWAEAPWGRYFLNTFLVATLVTLGELVTAVLAAYALARMSFAAKAVVFSVLLATYMIPSEATIIPNYVLMSRSRTACFGLPCLGLYDTYQAQIVPFLASVFSIFLLRQFFLSIPKELHDAATIDGAGHLRFLRSVVLPISVPALITVALISFLGAYNSFLWPLIVTSKDELRPIQVGMSVFRGEFGAQYHLQMAAATFVIAPIVGLYLVAQRYLVQGVARTGIRG